MKMLKKLLLAGLALFIILLVVLVIHIATAKPVVIDNQTLQISRIDFNEPMDTIQAQAIHRQLKSIPGVKNPKVVPDKGVAVYFHDNTITNAKEVYEALMAMGNYKASPFVVPETLAHKSVCPVGNTNSFSYKFSRGIQRIFN